MSFRCPSVQPKVGKTGLHHLSSAGAAASLMLKSSARWVRVDQARCYCRWLLHPGREQAHLAPRADEPRREGPGVERTAKAPCPPRTQREML